MSDIDISEPLSDMLAPLNNEQKEFLMNNYTIQTYKKNETIYCEGETPSHLMCLISGKVKIKNEKMNESIKRLHKSGSFRAILKTFYLVNNSSLYFGRGHISSSTSISKWSM